MNPMFEANLGGGTAELTEARILKNASSLMESDAFKGYSVLREQFANAIDGAETIENRHTYLTLAKTALAMERQRQFQEAAEQQYGKAQMEATYSANLSMNNPKLMDLVRIFYPAQVTNYLVDVQPLDRSIGQVFRIVPKFTNTRGSVTAGNEVFKTLTNGQYTNEEQTESLGTGNGSTTTFSATAALVAVRPSSVVIKRVGATSEDTIVATDNGSGVISGTDGAVAITGTVNYTTGAVSITYGTAPASGAITMTYDFNHESVGTSIAEVEFVIETVTVQAKPHTLKTKWSLNAGFYALAHAGIDVQDTLTQMAGGVIADDRDSYIIRKLDSISTANSTLNFNASTSSLAYDKRSFYSEVEIKLSYAGSTVHSTLGRGGVSYVVAGLNAADLFTNGRSFRSDNNMNPIGSHRIGTLNDGQIHVVKTRHMSTNDYVTGFYGYTAGDAPLIVADWIPLYVTPTIEYETLQAARGLVSFFAVKPNVRQYLLKGTISNYAA